MIFQRIGSSFHIRFFLSSIHRKCIVLATVTQSDHDKNCITLLHFILELWMKIRTCQQILIHTILKKIIFHKKFTKYYKRNRSKPKLFLSQDAHPSRYAAIVRVQANRVEIIQDLSDMVKDLIMMFYKSTGGYKPHRVIMYR